MDFDIHLKRCDATFSALEFDTKSDEPWFAFTVTCEGTKLTFFLSEEQMVNMIGQCAASCTASMQKRAEFNKGPIEATYTATDEGVGALYDTVADDGSCSYEVSLHVGDWVSAPKSAYEVHIASIDHVQGNGAIEFTSSEFRSKDNRSNLHNKVTHEVSHHSDNDGWWVTKVTDDATIESVS